MFGLQFKLASVRGLGWKIIQKYSVNLFIEFMLTICLVYSTPNSAIHLGFALITYFLVLEY